MRKLTILDIYSRQLTVTRARPVILKATTNHHVRNKSFTLSALFKRRNVILVTPSGPGIGPELPLGGEGCCKYPTLFRLKS